MDSSGPSSRNGSPRKRRRMGTVLAPNEDDINEIQKQRIIEEQRINPNTVSRPFCSYKVFNDPIHGHIDLHPLCVKMIDTPQFQRLRNIKQLGGCYHVFPGASHNRFEHSLGVSFLAGKLCQKLKQRQPELCITDEDILCIKIAGLCHDLGHGPFSHLFDGIFIPKARPEKCWKHERGSADMLEHTIQVNNLKPEFEKWNLMEKDISFIKQLILGCPAEATDMNGHGTLERQDKKFLYEIVANKRTGVDVDKWDYFARDCYHLGISNNFDYKRYMKFARVVEVDGEPQICTRDKEVGTLYDMFHTRNSLHRRAYQHKTVKIIDTMIVEALLKADPYVKLPGKDGSQIKISESVEDMYAFTHLTDNILSQIQISMDPKLDEAKEILQRIGTRDLYKLVGQTILKDRVEKTQALHLCHDIITYENTLDPADFTIQIIEFSYGMKDHNPIDQVRFYCKNNPETATRLRKDQVSQMLPETFAEQHLRLYCRRNNRDLIELGSRALESWCRENGNTLPKDGRSIPELTPTKNQKRKFQASPESNENSACQRALNLK